MSRRMYTSWHVLGVTVPMSPCKASRGSERCQCHGACTPTGMCWVPSHHIIRYRDGPRSCQCHHVRLAIAVNGVSVISPAMVTPSQCSRLSVDRRVRRRRDVRPVSVISGHRPRRRLVRLVICMHTQTGDTAREATYDKNKASTWLWHAACLHPAQFTHAFAPAC